jgi:hypothetical protein
MDMRTALESHGCVVAYVPEYASLEHGIEIGTIKGFGDLYVMVEFKGREGAMIACIPAELVFYDRPLIGQVVQNAFRG